MSTSTYEHPTGSGDPAGTPLDVTAIRRDFPIFETGIAYLDSANTSQRPNQVVAKMEEYFRKYNANVERAAYKLSEQATAEFEAVREKVRGFINARSAREIVYTSGTTGGLNLVAYSWGRSKELTAAAHAAGAVVVVDGAQGAPHLGLDVQDTDVDFYAFSPASSCQGTRLEWCSMTVHTIRSPLRMLARPQE